MTWNPMLFHLLEAHSALENVRDQIDATMKHGYDAEEFDGGRFYVWMEEAYHHVNTAWNCRHIAERRVWKCAWDDFRAWEKFPLEFNDLWLPPSRCRGKARKVFNWRLYPALSRLHVGKAMSAIDGIFSSLGTEMCIHRGAKWKILHPMTEEAFAAHLRHLYICMNRAWNERKVDSDGDYAPSATALRRHGCFPRAFSDLWPE